MKSFEKETRLYRKKIVLRAKRHHVEKKNFSFTLYLRMLSELEIKMFLLNLDRSFFKILIVN